MKKDEIEERKVEDVILDTIDTRQTNISQLARQGTVYIGDMRGTEEEMRNRTKIRNWLCVFFHSQLFHILLGFFILLDLGIVVTDITLHLSVCDIEEHSTVHDVTETLIILSIVILSIFIFELILQMWVFGFKKYWRSLMHAVDFIVVVVSFSFETVIISVDQDREWENIVGLLVFVRLWRVIRVMQVTSEAFELAHEEDVENLMFEIQEINKILKLCKCGAVKRVEKVG